MATGERDVAGDLIREAVQSAAFFEMGLMDGKPGAAQQSQGPDEIGIMVAHVLEPAFRRMGLRGPVADMVAGDVEGLAVAEAGMVNPPAQRAWGKSPSIGLAR